MAIFLKAFTIVPSPNLQIALGGFNRLTDGAASWSALRNT